MQTKTIDSIVRGVLHDLSLPLHWYTKYLGYALREAEELSITYPVMGNVKLAELTVLDSMRAALPVDFSSYLDVYVKSGEKLKALTRDKTLNLIPNLNDSDEVIAYPSSSTTIVINGDAEEGGIVLTAGGDHAGGIYGATDRSGISFNIDEVNDQIVFSNILTSTTVVLLYRTKGISTTIANVVHPFAIDAIEKAIHHKREKYGNKLEKTPYGRNEAHEDYKIAKRKMRARLFGMTAADMLRGIRDGIQATIKN
jgi:hypothetical protein